MASGGFKSWLAKNGLDLLLGGMSLFGGDEEQQQRRSSYNGAGLADPRTSLQQSIMAITRLMEGMDAVGSKSRPLNPGPGLPAGPSPVSFAGVQIGGGHGADPAQRYMTPDTSWMSMFQPSQGLATEQFRQAGSPPTSGARRRNPGGGQ